MNRFFLFRWTKLAMWVKDSIQNNNQTSDLKKSPGLAGGFTDLPIFNKQIKPKKLFYMLQK